MLKRCFEYGRCQTVGHAASDSRRSRSLKAPVMHLAARGAEAQTKSELGVKCQSDTLPSVRLSQLFRAEAANHGSLPDAESHNAGLTQRRVCDCSRQHYEPSCRRRACLAKDKRLTELKITHLCRKTALLPRMSSLCQEREWQRAAPRQSMRRQRYLLSTCVICLQKRSITRRRQVILPVALGTRWAILVGKATVERITGRENGRRPSDKL